MGALLSLLALLPVLLHTPSTHAALGCEFPDFLQSGDGFGTEIMREWHWHIMAGHHESAHAYTYVVKFEGKFMRVALRGSPRKKRKSQPFTRECKEEIAPGKFMALHLETDQQREKYICIEFLHRSENVIQIKESRMKRRRDPTLCREENMVLDRWPMINRIDIFKAHIDCPLTGGYNMKIYDKTEGLGVCDTFDGETRLESECMVGEGLFFRYRHENCIPTGVHMHTNQRTYCIANWQQNGYTFSIIRHDRSNHQWCFRFSTQHGKRFVGLLFKDVYCDTTDFPTDSLNYLELALTTDTPRPRSALCMNDYDACTTMWSNPCKHAGSVMHLTCASTCGICRNNSRPARCTLPGKFHGHWLDTSDAGRQTIEIDDRVLNERHLGQMECVRWQEGFAYGQPDHFEQMMVTTFDNGCRPRYQCLQLQKRNPSILRYKLSQSQIWPFEDTTGYVVDCSSFTFRDDDSPLRDKFRTRHFKTLISVSERIYVSCDLPHIFEFMVVYEDGTRCNGTLEQPTILSRTKMVMHLPRCPAKDEVQTFACLDSNRHGGYVSDQVIVTESQDMSSQLLCWLFPAVPGDVFYLLPASQCNEGAKDKITGLQLSPIAIFHKHRPPPIVESVVPKKPGDPFSPLGGGSLQPDPAFPNPNTAADGAAKDNETVGKRVEEKTEGQLQQRDKSPRSSPDERRGGVNGAGGVSQWHGGQGIGRLLLALSVILSYITAAWIGHVHRPMDFL